MTPMIADYDWDQHLVSQYLPGFTPEHKPMWIDFVNRLQVDPTRYQATTGYQATGSWIWTGWKNVLELKMRITSPFDREVPSVLLSGPDGSQWHSIMALKDIRERDYDL